MTRQKSYLKMYMRACLLSVMTFREQRARNPASPPAGRPGRQRHLRSRRLYPHRPHRRSHRPFCRRLCRQKHCRQRQRRLKHHRSVTAPGNHTACGPDYGSACPDTAVPQYRRRVWSGLPDTPVRLSSRTGRQLTEPVQGWAEPQGILQEQSIFQVNLLQMEKTIL